MAEQFRKRCSVAVLLHMMMVLLFLLSFLAALSSPAALAAPNCTDAPPGNEAQLRDWRSLAALFNASGGPALWRASDCWDATRPRLVCDGAGPPRSSWYGVSCDDGGRVWQLSLEKNGLRGRLDEVVEASRAGGGLDALSDLYLSSNSLSGTMPRGERWGMPALDFLQLNWNSVGGTLQTDWRGTNLSSLSLSYCKVAGELPGDWEADAERLTDVNLRGNLLSGTFPAVWSGFRSVSFLLLHENRVSGQLPSSYAGLDSFKSFQLNSNPLTGTLPDEWSGVDLVTSLNLRQTGMSSTVPRKISGLPSLLSLSVSGSELSGTFPWDLERPGATFNLSSVDVSGTRISGELTLEGWGPGLRGLSSLHLSQSLVSGTLSGSAGPAAGHLRTLHVADARLSGTLPRNWTGVPRMHDVDLSGNRLSGELPGTNLGFSSNLLLVRLGSNELSGTVYVPRPASGRSPPQLLDLQHNRVSGTLTPGLFFEVSQVLLGGNLLSGSLDDAFRESPRRAVRDAVLLSGNNLTGTIPAHLCAAGARNIDLSGNMLAGSVPRCLGRATGLLYLNLGSNRLDSIDRDFVGPELVSLSLERNLFTDGQLLQRADPTAAPLDGASLRSLDLSHNEIGTSAADALNGLVTGFPNLGELRLRGCSLSGGIGSVGDAPPAVLDLSGNPSFQGFNPAVLPTPTGLTVVNVTDTAFVRPLDETSGIRSLSRVGVRQPSCLPRGVLESAQLEHVDASSTRFHTSCLARTLRAIRPAGTGSRFFSHAGGLVCPQWVTRASSADVQADMDFAGYERCGCPFGRVWDAAAAACVPCPDQRRETLVCDPYVLAPRHCLLGERYAVGPGGEPPRTMDELLAATSVPCRRPGVCNPGADDCAGRSFADADHTNSNRSGDLAPACADGHEGFMCSRCSEGRWQSGDACLPCHAAFAWLVPLTMLIMLAGAAAFLWRKAGQTPDGSRALAVALFWLQLSSLLETSSQVQAGNQSSSTWQWLAATEAAAQSWAVVQPWAAQCVGHGFDFVDASLALLAAPAVVATLGAAAVAVSPPEHARRVRFVAAFLLLSLFLPSVTRALQAFPCESVPGTSLSFLTAAPYVACDDSGRLALLRTAAGLSLALYAVPLAATVLVQLHRARARRAGRPVDVQVAATTAAHELDLPLLDHGDNPRPERPPGQEHSEPATPLPPPPPPPLVDLLLTSTLRDPDGMWWWPAAYDIGRGVALAVVVGLLPSTSPLLPMLVFAVLSVAVLLQTRFRPAVCESDNTLESVVLLAAMSTYLLNISSGASAHRGFASESSAATVRAVLSSIRAGVLALLVAAVARAARAAGSKEQHHQRG